MPRGETGRQPSGLCNSQPTPCWPLAQGQEEIASHLEHTPGLEEALGQLEEARVLQVPPDMGTSVGKAFP